ncbi:hypothetical protein HDU76_004984, partial [Blyttiomyces sp. JEL0837]
SEENEPDQEIVSEAKGTADEENDTSKDKGLLRESLGKRQGLMTEAVNSDDWNVETSPAHDGRFERTKTIKARQ